ELDGLMKGLETGAGLERFSGLMDKQSKSLAGVVSTLKDTVSQGLADLIAPAIPAITAGVEQVGTIVGSMIDGIKAAMPAVKGALDPVIS
ncbi:hypothetical protein, partial [Salmonella enterica]|uniref:hypothetical protein n=1 Tax=Salmonella enterica TaxID=28901 RepID=UPI003CF5485D